MKSALIRVLARIVSATALVMPTAGYPQAPAALSPQQLEQMLAPIALYPDPLLGQILMASTYPLEVIEAARWLQAAGNVSLVGDQLAVTLQAVNWDPSVKSLVPFPQILQMMNSQLGWMQQLGDAFLAQQADVMDSVQRLRARASAAGTLYSTPEAIVSSDGTTTTIEPADPQLVYVPSYDPNTTYGDWPYPDYSPYYFPFNPDGMFAGGGIGFGIAIAVVVPLWGWEDCDWRRHRIRIEHDRYDAINRDGHAHGRPSRPKSETWEHDPFHRRGVAYRDEGSRQKFLGTRDAGQANTRKAYRGFEGTPRIAPQTQPIARPAPVQANPPRFPATFGDMDRGRDVRREAERGHASREAMAPPAPRQPTPAPRQVEPRRGAPAVDAARREH